MAKVAYGCRASWFAIGVAFGQCLPGSLSLGGSRLQIFEGALALIGGQLLGPLALKRLAQFGDPLPGSGLPSILDREVILTYRLGLQPFDLGIQGCKRLMHGGRKGI